MIRKSNKFARPRKAYEKSRMEEENKLLEKYGLKSKREVWKAIAKVDYFRRRAKALANASSEEQTVFFDKLKLIGLNTSTIADVLALKKEDLLERRLPTILARKGLATTTKQARQLVAHKKVAISGNIINVPSYIVSVDEENKITIRGSKPKVKNLEVKESGESNVQ